MNNSLLQNDAVSKVAPSSQRQKLSSPLTQGIRRFLALVSLLSIGLVAIPAGAADADPALGGSAKTQAPIAINLKQFRVVQGENGDTRFLDARVVMPGDVIEYRATYVNRGSSTLPVVATMPIPESMEYIKDSAQSNKKLAHTVALKDAQFSNEPLLQKVLSASGVTQSQPVPYASYRYVRWDLGRLAPGNAVEVSVRAKVAQTPEVDANAEVKASALTSSSLNK